MRCKRAGGFAVPDDGRFALVGDADGNGACGFQRYAHDFLRIAPDIVGVLRGPSRYRDSAAFSSSFWPVPQTLPAASNKIARLLVCPDLWRG